MAGAAIIAKIITLTGTYQAASATTNIASVRVTNEGAATNYMLSDDGQTDVPIKATGQWDFHGVDLANLQFKGTVGQIITIIGMEGQWGR